MSRFYSSVTTERSTATKRGHQYMDAHIRGWHAGVNVRLTKSDKPRQEKTDCITVYLTAGSNGGYTSKCILSMSEDEIRSILAGEKSLKLIVE